MEKIQNELKQAGYEFGVAIATEAEIANGAACGKLAVIFDCDKDKDNT